MGSLLSLAHVCRRPHCRHSPPASLARRLHLRRAGAQRAPPFLTLPLPAWLTSSGRRSYFDMAGPDFSGDEQLMAYALDLEGSEVYAL